MGPSQASVGESAEAAVLQAMEATPSSGRAMDGAAGLQVVAVAWTAAWGLSP